MKTVIELALEAGFDCAPDGHIYNSGTTDSTPLDDVIKHLVELVRADEREACAALCDRFANRMMSAEECADAIRARGNT